MSLIAAILVATAVRTAEFRNQAPVLEMPSPAAAPDIEEPRSRRLSITPSPRSRARTSAGTGDLAGRPRGLGGGLGGRSRGGASNGSPLGTGPVSGRPTISIPGVAIVEPTDRSDNAADRRSTDGGMLGEGFWAAAWSSIPAGLDNVEVMVRLDGNGVDDDSWTSRHRFLAPWIASELALRPEGRRFLFAWRYRHCLLSDDLDRVLTPEGDSTALQSPFVSDAASRIRNEIEPVLAELHALGARPDGLILDIESAGSLSSWKVSPTHLNAILADPRMQSHQLSNGRTPREMIGEHTAAELTQTTSGRAAWNATVDLLFTDAMNSAMFEPAVDLWPELVGSNYRSFVVAPHEASPDHNAHPAWGAGRFGTSSSVATYGRVRNLSRFWDADPSDPTRLIRTDHGDLATDGWTGLLVDVNQTRSMRRTDGRGFHPWIAQSDWQTDDGDGSRYPGSPYWVENIFHQALGGAEVFLYWNPSGAVHAETAADRDRRFEDARLLETVLDELNGRLRGATSLRPCRTARVRWDADALLSGAILPDETGLWRLTLSPEAWSARLRVGDRTIDVVPGGRGTWIATSAGETVEIVGVILEGGEVGRF